MFIFALKMACTNEQFNEVSLLPDEGDDKVSAISTRDTPKLLWEVPSFQLLHKEKMTWSYPFHSFVQGQTWKKRSCFHSHSLAKCQSHGLL